MKTAVRQLTFSPQTGEPEYIDLGECLSLVNRQAFHQGYVYLVESFAWEQGNGQSVNLSCLPTSWTVYNSWKKAKRLFDKMNRQSGLKRSDYPAYHDYKVFFEEAHYVGWNNIANLLPLDGFLAPFSNIGREWIYSQYVTPTAGGSGAAEGNACHMLGGDSLVNNPAMLTDGSSAIIQMYGDTRPTVGASEPDMPSDASQSWATELFDTGETLGDLVNHLEGVNDRPPYAHALDAPEAGDNPIYVGGSESGVNGHRLCRLEPIASETVYAPGGEIPLGLIKVQTSLEGGQTGVLTVNLAPGVYQGIAAMPMGKVQT